jgi:predicted nuclease with TOPRIM domain
LKIRLNEIENVKMEYKQLVDKMLELKNRYDELEDEEERKIDNRIIKNMTERYIKSK